MSCTIESAYERVSGAGVTDGVVHAAVTREVDRRSRASPC